MKLVIYTLATDGDDGTQSQVFTNEAARTDALLDWIGSDREEWKVSDQSDDLSEFVSARIGHLDTYSMDEHDIDLSDLSLSLLWSLCKSAPGAFGALYDPDDVLTTMDGWAATGDMSDGSHWFDPTCKNDREAILAWCEQEGPKLEQRISDLVCEAMPTRGQAFDALVMKRSAPQTPIIL